VQAWAERLRLAIGAGVRRVPGGEASLRLRRRVSAAVRRRFDPVKPPLHSPLHVAAFLETADDHPFITGNRLAARCRYVVNYDDLVVNEDVDNDWWFVQSDFLEHFFRRLEPSSGSYVLFSHNGDRAVDRSLRRFLRRPRLHAWFAANAALVDPKLHAFPLGIADRKWRHGDGAALLRVQHMGVDKTNLVDASYDVSTFPTVREHCRTETGIAPPPRREFEEYLHGLASSYFCIAPRGHGPDTHRVWEALYLRTVPVVTRSVLTDQHPDVPMIVLDDWADFRRVELAPELYAETWGAFDPQELELDRYLQRVAALIRAR